VENEDPRKELVQKLLEYQKYQEAAKLLYDRPLVGRDVWLRGQREVLTQMEDEIVLEENALFSLISSYRRMLRSVKNKVHQVAQKAQSISGRIMEMRDRLIVGRKITLMELVTSVEHRARETLITFLSLLELGKMGFVGLYQTEAYSDIWVDTRKTIEVDVLSRVEEYDSMNAAEAASKIIEDSKKLAADDELLVDLEIPEEESAQLELGAGLEDGLDMIDAGDEAVEAVEDLASDEEILAAESELFKEDESSGLA
jgi:segregation and condensation protein A